MSVYQTNYAQPIAKLKFTKLHRWGRKHEAHATDRNNRAHNNNTTNYMQQVAPLLQHIATYRGILQHAATHCKLFT